MGPSPQQNLQFRKNGKTFLTLRDVVKHLNIGELRNLVKILKGNEYFQPRVTAMRSAGVAPPVFFHGYGGPIGRKTKGARDASQRSRSNRRKP